MSDREPWDDWTPGVLSKDQMLLLIQKGYLRVDSPEHSLGASSLDLTLSAEVHHLHQGTIKPSGHSYHKHVHEFGQRLDDMGSQGMTLEPQKTYLVKLRERLYGLNETFIHGQATAKSSVGRVDVLARLVVDGMDCYESFSPDKLGTGELFLEITPLTFPVQIRPGTSLSQIRLFYGDPEGCRLSGKEAYQAFLKNAAKKDGTLSVDLEPAEIRGHEVIAFRAKTKAPCQPVPLWQTDMAPPPWDYWDFVKPNESKRLSLTKGSFYILKSKELLALPKGVAVYCRAIDESFGEMRIHYAGFAHPWFGRARKDGQVGTPLIFEVRGHDVNVSLQDNESMARLLFYRMSEDAAMGESDQIYEVQTLQLSKFFGQWPERIVVDVNGAVQPA